MSDTSKRELSKLAIRIQTLKEREKQIAAALAAADKIIFAFKEKLVERVLQKIERGNCKTISDITENRFLAVRKEVAAILHDENSLIELDWHHVIVVGNIQGQLRDLIQIFDKCGYPPYHTYLFLVMSIIFSTQSVY